MFSPNDRPVVQFEFDQTRNRIGGFLLLKYPNGHELAVDCCVDTGATRTVIPRKYWDDGGITESDLRRWAVRSTSIKRIDGTDEGLVLNLPLSVSGTAADAAEHVIPACEVVFALDRNRLHIPQALFGLGGGTLTNGGLCIDVRQGHAALVVARPAP